MSATGRGSVRNLNDNYVTPDWFTKAILPYLETRLKTINAWQNVQVYEPACGEQQAMANVIRNAWSHAEVSVSDIISPWTADFINLHPTPHYDLIITNPPYLLAHEFIKCAMQWRKTDESLVVMLLRLNFLGSKKRAKWLRDNTPTVAVSPRRPSFSLNKHGVYGTDATEYGFFVWPATNPMLLILETEDK